MKQKIKFLIASIMILFLSSCEKDLYEDSINNNSKKYIIQTINLNTYNKKPSDLLTFKSKLDNKKRISFESKIVYDSINNFYIDDENVRLIQSDNIESYTIGIKYENSDKIHNIVFDQNEEGAFDSYLVKYDFTSEELNTLSTDVLETKEIIYIPIEFDENGIMRFENPYGGLVCIQEWSTEYNMWANVSGGGNNPSPTTPTITGNFCQYISTDLSGGGSAPVETNNTGGNNSGYSGGGYNTGNNSNLNTTGGVYGNGGIDGTGIITSPVVVNHILLDFIRNLTPTQLLWWNNPINDEAVDSISNYLLDVEADQAFAIELINTSIQLEINMVDIWNNDYEAFRNQMSNSERAIFDSILPNRQMWYMASAYKALIKSSELFPDTFVPSNSHNGKGDAFRHALWNAYCTGFFGATLAEQLTTAHEDNVNPYNPFPEKEIEMDLYNNEKGRIIGGYSNINNVTQNVLNYFNIGGLRYLNALNTSPPFYPTFYSTLIPTDQ